MRAITAATISLLILGCGQGQIVTERHGLQVTAEATDECLAELDQWREFGDRFLDLADFSGSRHFDLWEEGAFRGVLLGSEVFLDADPISPTTGDPVPGYAVWGGAGGARHGRIHLRCRDEELGSYVLAPHEWLHVWFWVQFAVDTSGHDGLWRTVHTEWDFYIRWYLATEFGETTSSP